MKTIDKSDLKDKVVTVKWLDACCIRNGWQDLEDLTIDAYLVDSWGRVVYEDDKIIAVSSTYHKETEDTNNQINGGMIIPKGCIAEIIPF